MKRKRSVLSQSILPTVIWKYILLLQISILQHKIVHAYYPPILQYPQTITAFSPTFKRTILYMGKGDGKKKRKKKSPFSTEEPTSSTPQEPRRVSTDINIPIRRQIKWAQLNKEIEKQSSFRAKNIQRTKYRKSLDEEQEEEMKLIRSSRGREPDWDVILNATLSSPLVIIDAYNVIFKYSKLKKEMNKGLLSKARDTLIYELEELRTVKGWRIEVVFDGMKKVNVGPLGSGPESRRIGEQPSPSAQQANKKVTNHGVRVVYSGVGTSADAYIEARCYDAKQTTNGQYTNSLIVASDDGMIRSAAANAGALVMSSQRIVDELKALKKVISYKVEVAVARNNGHDVRHESLRGVLPGAFTRGAGQFLIVDKRKKDKIVRSDDDDETKDVKEIMEGTTTTPSWAILPNQDIKKDPS